MWCRAGIFAVLMGICGLLATSALAEPPRQTYSERFTTDVPGAPTGRGYVIDWFDPSDPAGKPASFSHLRVTLAPGSRFDTRAIPQCKATDAELMLMGASACPAASIVARDDSVIDSGFPGPGRFFTSDFVFFNNQDELVLLSTVRGTGARVVLRARIGVNTIDLDVPFLPGSPPDGGAATSQRGTFYSRSTVRDGVQRSYITTPPTCPASGHWVNRVTYTYRDGVTQSATSRTPCRPAGSVVASCAGRRATIVGTSRPDRLRGTPGDDVIVSFEGGDRVRGGGGRDIVCAGRGRDRVRGGAGRDRLYGQRGGDRLAGGSGADRLRGGPGRDRLAGGSGRDRLLGGSGRDRLAGGPGRDREGP